MRRWDGLVEKHVKDCESRGLAPSTIEKRTRELERIGAWLKRRRPKRQLEQVDGDLIVRYVSSRAAFRSRATVSSVVSDLRMMGEFLVREGIWRTSPLRWMRGPKMDPRRLLPRGLGREQLEKIWEAARARHAGHARHLALCTLAVLYGTGLRRGELERLDVGAWDRDAGLLKIDGRKTGQARHVAISAGVFRCIEAYLPHRHNVLEKVRRVDEQALLVNRIGERLSGASISRLVRGLADRAGIEGVTLHRFRHSCATDLLEAGASLPEVQRVLGHAAIASTVRYAAVTDPRRAAAMRTHPINEFLTQGAMKEAS